jgi:nitrogen regulatory protein P-II 1
MEMKKVEAYVRPSCIGNVIAVLNEVGIEGISLTDIEGYGKQKGRVDYDRGSEYPVNLLPKVKIELFVKDAAVGHAVQAIREAAFTGQMGDGKIFVLPVEEGYQIRTGQQGEAVL